MDAEVKRWKAKSCEQLVAELPDEHIYEVEFEGRRHQVEVRILKSTDTDILVAVSVDDGSLPASLSPLFQSFIQKK